MNPDKINGNHRQAALSVARRRWKALRKRQGLAGQGTRYALAGATVAFVYLVSTTTLSLAVGLAFQAALAIGYGLAVIVHFTLQRKFVWAGGGEFALPLTHQTARYLLASGSQYGLTALGTSLLPSALGLSEEVVYLAVVAALISANFLMFRHFIFHGTAEDEREEPSSVTGLL